MLSTQETVACTVHTYDVTLRDFGNAVSPIYPVGLTRDVDEALE